MKAIRIKSYAKINLSLDVIGKMDNGYHEVEMVMQQIALCDEVLIRWYEEKNKDGIHIELKSNRPYLPTDERNLAKKAAVVMSDLAKHKNGTLKIDILKRIPVAAGLAGGSGNGAAVIHGLNKIWGMGKSLSELCDIGEQLGADVPFMIMGQAKTNKNLDKKITEDNLATCCAFASGIGTVLRPVKALNREIILSKPRISVSTAEVYGGINLEKIKNHPNNKELIEGLNEENFNKIEKNIANVLEEYTVNRYDVVKKTKEIMSENCPNSIVAMSGSGPSVFAIMSSQDSIDKAYENLKKINKETYKTRTMI